MTDVNRIVADIKECHVQGKTSIFADTPTQKITKIYIMTPTLFSF